MKLLNRLLIVMLLLGMSSPVSGMTTKKTDGGAKRNASDTKRAQTNNPGGNVDIKKVDIGMDQFVEKLKLLTTYDQREEATRAWLKTSDPQILVERLHALEVSVRSDEGWKNIFGELSSDTIVDKDGNTPLHWAATLQYVEICRVLMEHAHANPKKLNSAGKAPHYTIIQKSLKNSTRGKNGKE